MWRKSIADLAVVWLEGDGWVNWTGLATLLSEADNAIADAFPLE